MAPENPGDKTRHRLTTAVVAGYEGDRTRFRLDIDERQQAMDALLYGKPFELQPGHSLTVQNLWHRSEQIADELDQRLDSDQHIAAATVHPYDTNDREALYYNRITGVTAQIPLVLAAIQSEDTPTTIREKARVAANYVDLLAVLRAINDDSTRPDDLDQEVLDVVPPSATADPPLSSESSSAPICHH
jgi:hypothetical protein